MIKRILLTLTLAVAGVAQASIYDYNFDGAAAPANGTIVDGNPAGVANTIGVTIPVGGDVVDSLVGVRVLLNVSGGFNGDLYGYLTSPTGVRVDLVNNIGATLDDPAGNGGNGMSVILDATTAGSIQDVGLTGNPSGSYHAAGDLGTLNGLAASGTWTLYLADTSLGGGNETLTGWGLELNVVPEPVTWALLLFALGFGAAGLRRRYQRRVEV